MNQTIDLMMNHVSVRKFTDEPIPAQTLDAIIDAGRAASSWKAFWSYSIVVVESAETKQALFDLVPQPAITGCSAFLLFVGDLTLAAQAAEMHDAEFQPKGVESLLISSVDGALAAQNTLLAAESLGYGGVVIGLVRYESAKISELLGLPKYTYPLFGIALGKPARTFAVKPRLPFDVQVHRERYRTLDKQAGETVLREHDAAQSEYFGGRTAEDWSERLVAQWGVPEVPSSTEHLKASGLL
ncbi:MAG: nitroreductase family protein [Promicromonosporaceae bacterium]|nr:nitroreductase family protein [Promicromonosporaceae bacterium]